jgi:hypothetical protein
MPTSGPSWPTKALGVLVPLVGLDLIIQYVAGLGTNVYAPADGFTMNTAFGVYNVHWLNGYVLGILCIVLVIVTVFSRRTGAIAASTIVLLAVLVAGIEGMIFVNNTPNPAGASLAMGLAFLVAFSTVMAMAFRMRMGDGSPPPRAVAPA